MSLNPRQNAVDFLPPRRTLSSLRAAAKLCHGCDLYQRATQTVFGEGPRSSRIVIVGETPGNEEDLQGKPFVGPAGRVLNEALNEAGIQRKKVYLTNAVKHFKWEPRGKKRLHKKPSRREVVACRAWLEAEIFAIKPEFIVVLGATAAQSLLGTSFFHSISRQSSCFVYFEWENCRSNHCQR